MMLPIRRIVGCMTGTSIDGLDAALVEVVGMGYDIRAEFKRGLTLPLGELAGQLRKLATGVPLSAQEIATIAYDFSLLHVEAVASLLSGEKADFIVAHGQTVFHAPPLSWQLFNPYPLHNATGLPVLYDLRGADLAAGGQGAPITPISDYVLFRHTSETRLIVNLGGFINATVLTKAGEGVDGIRGGDVCACNQLLDGLARMLLGVPYDDDGGNAAKGMVIASEYENICGMLDSQANGGRSLGSGDEVAGYVEGLTNTTPPGDILRTACAAIAATLAGRYFGGIDRVILAGGGARNRILRQEIAVRATCPVNLSDDFGIPIEYREAAGMAVIGALVADGVPTTLLQVTGAAKPTSGGVWCGSVERPVPPY